MLCEVPVAADENDRITIIATDKDKTTESRSLRIVELTYETDLIFDYKSSYLTEYSGKPLPLYNEIVCLLWALQKLPLSFDGNSSSYLNLEYTSYIYCDGGLYAVTQNLVKEHTFYKHIIHIGTAKEIMFIYHEHKKVVCCAYGKVFPNLITILQIVNAY